MKTKEFKHPFYIVGDSIGILGIWDVDFGDFFTKNRRKFDDEKGLKTLNFCIFEKNLPK
jgi:hypothetical protein